MLVLKRFLKILLLTNFAFVMGTDLLFAADINEGFSLSWKNVPQATAYQVEISKNSRMETILFSEKTKETKYIWHPQVAGTYYWRVRAINGIGNLQAPSEIGTLRAKVDSPTILNNEIQIDRSLEEKESAVETLLKWNAHPDINDYRVETSTTSDFKIIKSYTAKNQTHLMVTTKESLFWRVVALNKTNEVASDYSTIGNIKINDESPPIKGLKNINVTAGTQFWKMDSVDTGTTASAQFLSSRCLNFKVDTKFQIYDRTALNLKLGMTSLSVQSPVNKTLRTSAYTNLDFGFDINQRFSKVFSAYFSADLEQDLFIRAQTLNTLSFDPVGIFKFSLGVNREITTVKNWKISGNAFGRYLGGSRGPTYTIWGGYAWGAGVTISKKFSQYGTGLGLNYYQEVQNTSIARQTQGFIGLNIIFSWESLEKTEKK